MRMREQARMRMPMREHRSAAITRPRDRGVVTSVEMMFVLIFLLGSLVFLGFLGRLHAAGVQLGNTSASAARAASMAGDAASGRKAAEQAVMSSTLVTRCATTPKTELTWTPSSTGSWQGGSVTVTITCTVPNGELSGIWTPGDRTLRASDTQPIDRYQR